MAKFVPCASEDEVRAAHSAGALYWKSDIGEDVTKEHPSKHGVVELYELSLLQGGWRYGILVEDEDEE